MTRIQFLFLNLYHITIDGLYDSVPILLTFIIVYFGGHERQIGYIVSAGSFFATICGIYTLFFAQRFSFQFILGIIALLYGIGFTANSFSQNIAYSGFFFVLAVMGHSVFHNIAFSHITRTTDRKILGRTLSDFTAYGDIGRIPLTALAGYMAAVPIMGIIGWRVISFSYGLLILAIGVSILLYAKKTNIFNATGNKQKRNLPSLHIFRDNKDTKMALIASIISAISSDQIFIFLPSLLLFKGFDYTILGSLALGFTIGCFIGKTIFGRLVDRYGARKVFIFAQIMLTLFLIMLIKSSSLYGVLTLALLIGIVTKGTLPVIQTMLIEPLADDKYYNDIFTVNGFTKGFINVIAPASFGIIATKVDLNFIFILMAISATISIMPILSKRSV